ncbi:MAG: tetratricopeptide repeat protein [Deltaproteobacteria bacterium]|nr:MAG: tetratricopeptide repeat protein [Deltaproteobacteria bacterium]
MRRRAVRSRLPARDRWRAPPRFLRRAASCALAAGQPRSAVEYAKKAHSLSPADPSAARLLAAAFRAAGKLSDAEEVLVMAMALKSENDVLTSELRNDLAEVRRLLAQS